MQAKDNERKAVGEVERALRDAYEKSKGYQPKPELARQIREYVEKIGQEANKKNKRDSPIIVRRR